MYVCHRTNTFVILMLSSFGVHVCFLVDTLVVKNPFLKSLFVFYCSQRQ